MVDEYQVEYEYSDGNTISFKTNDLRIAYKRQQWVDQRVDGTIVVTDTGNTQRTFTFTAYLSGATMDTLDSVQMAAITYSGAYPRIKTIYWNGATTETNIEVSLAEFDTLDSGMGWWLVSARMVEKDQ